MWFSCWGPSSVFRRDKAEEELSGSLAMDDEPIPFQLASCNISVPISDGGKERFSFHAIVVETSTQHTAALCEWFYELGNSLTATKRYPYIGGYQFVPMLKSKEWPISKIYHLA